MSRGQRPSSTADPIELALWAGADVCRALADGMHEAGRRLEGFAAERAGEPPRQRAAADAADPGGHVRRVP